MPKSPLVDALTAIKWSANVEDFCKHATAVPECELCNTRLALWAKQLESADRNNPALPFIREMQASGHAVPALTALAMYKPAAAAMRTVVESALYYTYFRSHPAELATLVRDSDYYMSKVEIMAYHKTHTPRFSEVQSKVSLETMLNEWYSSTSAIVHGQIPGSWASHSSLSDVRHKHGMIEEVVKSFQKCVDIVHALLLCTVSRELWVDFAPQAKKALLKGMLGDVKSVLSLDSA